MYSRFAQKESTQAVGESRFQQQLLQGLHYSWPVDREPTQQIAGCSAPAQTMLSPHYVQKVKHYPTKAAEGAA